MKPKDHPFRIAERARMKSKRVGFYRTEKSQVLTSEDREQINAERRAAKSGDLGQEIIEPEPEVEAFEQALTARRSHRLPKVGHPVCSICRRRHGLEVIHACE